jgi:hypothetical protein
MPIGLKKTQDKNASRVFLLSFFYYSLIQSCAFCTSDNSTKTYQNIYCRPQIAFKNILIKSAEELSLNIFKKGA